ncbi:outer membrane protein assembly factor BamB [Limnobacter sp.]|uniref:outer membrane protein assembly factor BamB n=1 Tax=Limnobacter sp. TaxID=2003368 RepID=UPI0035146360
MTQAHTLIGRAGMALCMLALVSGCSTLSKLNPFGSGAVKPAELVAFTPSLNVNTAWKTDIGESEGGYFSPAVFDDTVYLASEKGQVRALNRSNGQVKWTIKTDAKLKAGVAATVDTVAVVDVNNRLLAFDTNGKQKWTTSLGVEVSTVPVGSVSTLLVRGIDFSIVALATENGAQRWKYSRQLPPLTLRINSPVDVNNARVYAGFPGGRLVALDLNNGNVVWEGSLATPTGTTEIERIADVTGSPVYNFREVCAASFQGRLGCLDAVSARPIWSVEFSSPSGVSVDDRYMIAPNELGDLFAFSRTGGKQVWRIENFQRRQPTTPTVVGRAAVIGDFEGYVHFIDRDTGKTIARTRVGKTDLAAPPMAIDGNSVLVQSRDGDVALLTIQ